jgi:HD-GYP domain-containing protein (c-di-GMP phosphodiesterase class II)
MSSTTSDKNSVFSINSDFIPLNIPLTYSLYVNASGHESKDRFVKIFATPNSLSSADLAALQNKYKRLYVLEGDRTHYLNALVKMKSVSDLDKTTVVKESAIGHLDNLFRADHEFTTEVLNETISGCKDAVNNMIEVMHDYNVNKVQDLIGSLSFHDFYTYDHSINVSMYCITLYKIFKPEATRDELIHAGLGGMLHDIGKLKIPTHIINNPNKLSDEEFKEIQKHPAYGQELIHQEGCQCGQVNLDLISKVLYQHHENFNGTGYPNKIQGNDIHVLARMTAIADFFDAITTKRSYHDVLSTEEAILVMTNSRGSKLDPKLFDLFAKKVYDIKNSANKNSKKVLAEDFDPCSPHQVLPFLRPDKALDTSTDKEFGKVKIEGNIFGKK